MSESSCYTVVFESPTDYPSVNELRTALQKGNDEVKLETLRKIIISTMNGNSQPTLVMPIIQYVMPTKNKQLKKLLHFYWEVCPKYEDNVSGKLKQEMILVVNAIRNDLQHPNEYIRGATLRFLQKIAKDQELLEDLIPTCRSCLEHRHSYVRKNAVFAIYSIYKAHPHLIPDAPELIFTFLVAESDSTCKRNAFIFLAHCDMPRAIQWIAGQGEDGINGMDEGLQLAVIEVIRTDCKTDTAHKSRYIRLIFSLLNASSHAVKYEAATTITTLSSNPTAVKAASQTLLTLAQRSSDNNVKLIVLSRLDNLRRKFPTTLSPLIMDLCSVLASAASDIEVRRRALGIILSMTKSRNAEEVVLFLKKQLVAKKDDPDGMEYRSLLIQNIHVMAIKFPEVSGSVVTELLEFLGETNNPSALDVVAFVREVTQKFPELRHQITPKLRSVLPLIKSGKVYRGILWILGEYVTSSSEIRETVDALRGVIGEIPILAAEQRAVEGEEGEGDEAEGKDEEEKKEKKKPRVLEDGTYATDVGDTSPITTAGPFGGPSKPPLRALILGGDYFTSSVLASALTKFLIRYFDAGSHADAPAKNAMRAEAMLIMTSIIRVGQSKFVTVPIDEDTLDRIMTCIQTLSVLSSSGIVGDNEKKMKEVFLVDSEKAYEKMLGQMEKRNTEKKAQQEDALQPTKKEVQVDDLIHFRMFKKGSEDDGLDEDEDLSLATGTEVKEDIISELNRISQLTGFSDPIYAEAYVKMHGFDIMLDVLLVNQTSSTLQNLCLDFATLGDLKLTERPSVYTIAPNGFLSVKASIKVSSTETGVIFGSILWEGEKMEECCVVLNDIHVDIMDYIKPAYCNEAQFRSMWTEFEWENRVNVNNTISDPLEYLHHVMKATNMSCLTPLSSLSSDCDFLSANMYARSLFGEDALANLSIERKRNYDGQDGGSSEEGVTGHVRIRSKTQGIALSLGDRITMATKDGKSGSS